MLDYFPAHVCSQRNEKEKGGVHRLPTWNTVSFCVHIHINLKPDLLVLSMEFRTASRVRRKDGTEEADVVSCEIRRPGFSPGCNPSDKVDFSNLTSLKWGFLCCEMGTIMPTAVGGDGVPDTEKHWIYESDNWPHHGQQ